MRINMKVAAVLVALMAVCMSGFAAEPKGWQFETAIYGWYAGLEGDMSVRNHTADFEKSASDLLDALEIGGSLFGVAQYDRFLVMGQVDYFSMSTDKLSADDQPRGGSLDAKELLSQVGIGYQFDGWAEGQRFDMLIGIKTLGMENDLEVFAGGTHSKDICTADPVLIIRPVMPVMPSVIKGLNFSMIASIGGGVDADLVYELFPELQYMFTDSVSGRLGYRVVGYEYDGDGRDNELDIRQSGPIAGVGVIF